jgi:hypothetical protein
MSGLSAAGISLATFCANLIETAPAANLLMTSFLTFNLLFVGFVIPEPKIPLGWIWSHWFNVFRYPCVFSFEFV